MKPNDREHIILYEQAVEEARAAYNQANGIGFPWGVMAAAGALPVWRSGGKRKLTFFEFVRNHTIWAETRIPEYIPAEDYQSIFEKEVQH